MTLLTPEEAAELLRIKISKLRSAIFKKEIVFVKFGRLIRFDKDDLIKWVEEKKQNNSPQKGNHSHRSVN